MSYYGEVNSSWENDLKCSASLDPPLTIISAFGSPFISRDSEHQWLT